MKKNVASTVMPLKNKNDIEKIKRYFLRHNNYRNYCLFVVGINVGLRISDLLSLKINDFWSNGEFKSELVVVEQKTQKLRRIKINNSVKEAINQYIYSLSSFSEADYLFKSRKGANKAIDKKTAHQIIADVCYNCNIKGNYGTHTLRKTFAYQIYINNSENVMILEYIMKLLNHSSQSMTIKYLGLEKETLDNFIDDLNL